MAISQKHGYDGDAPTTMNWHVPADGTLDFEREFDDDVEIQATDGERESYEPRRGATFVATDTEEVYRGDGTTWNHIGHVVEFPADVLDADASSR